jgi:uncharacterized protein YyaL (SSP411 family)
MSEPAFTNRLAGETSPYLRQHQHNPVDWYPWGPEALARARSHDRPIFLSIGYSACHWCHVMEHESFENPEIARYLNEHFVPIKVDREERPDLDQIYMASVQMLTGQGGWPMSVFLTPDLRPFTGGTYFPPDDRYGRPGFRRVLAMIADAWETRRPEIDDAAGQITERLQLVGQLAPETGDLHPEQLRNAVRLLGRNFDSRYGGFGGAPKFPHPMDLRFLLRAANRFGDQQALDMVRLTLDSMAEGGIYDHLGGGFARYSTDERWLVPHFEKMLYDNALLALCYTEAYQMTGNPAHREVVEETLGWVVREMTSPEGPFYSTLDADSEGEEGRFYVWTEQEILEHLGEANGRLFCTVYGVEESGNWEDPHAPGQPKNVLHRARTLAQVAKMEHLDEAQVRDRIDAARRVLFQVRERRVRPGLDDKILTAWNGLMIAAFSLAAQAFDRADHATVAGRAADFILTRMRGPGGKLLRTCKVGVPARLNGYLEDYAYLIDALVSLYETTFEPRWIHSALELADILIDQFLDREGGGFFFTGRDHEELIARSKDPYDNATPSGNAMAVTGLLRLAQLTGRNDLLDQAERTLGLYSRLMAEHPSAVGQMLVALDFHLGPTQEIAVVGDRSSEDTRRVLRAIRGGFQPNKVVALLQPGAEAPAEIPLLADKKSSGGQVTTWICQNFTCQAPLVGAEAAEQFLKPSSR